MKKELQEKIIKRMEEKGVTLPCPRCGGDSFSLKDGFALHLLQDDIKNRNSTDADSFQ